MTIEREEEWGSFTKARWDGGFEPLPEQPQPEPAPKRTGWLKRPVRRRTVLRAVLLTIHFAGLAGLLAWHFGMYRHAEATPARPTTQAPLPYYGDTAVPMPGLSAGERSACVDELRLRPTGGRWRCRQWLTVDANDTTSFLPPRNAGGPCTHRIVDIETSGWACWTSVALTRSVFAHGNPRHIRYYGDITVPRPANSGPAVCDQELRSSPARGPWKCVSWKGGFAGMVPVQARDQGGPCALRVADQATGYWSCQSGSPLAVATG